MHLDSNITVLTNEEVWHAHGAAVEHASHYLPGSYNCKPHNIAEKIHIQYKTWKFQLYTFTLTPILLYSVLPQAYWQNYCNLVHGFQIMCQSTLTKDELLDTQALLCSWEYKFELIYYKLLESHIHFVQPCVHQVIHLISEAIHKEPSICYAQWIMEWTIRNLGKQIWQHSKPFINTLLSVMPKLNDTENGLPYSLVDLSDGYILLCKCAKNSVIPLNELQLTFLQDWCNTLEQHLVKVTTKHDTIKNLFDQLASVVKLTPCDASLLSGTMPLQVLTMMDKKPLTCETHLNVCFWTNKDFDNWLDSAEAEGSDHSIYAYLEEEDGKVLSLETLANIHRSLHTGWRELTQSNVASETWGKASIKAHQFLCFTMEKVFPLFKFGKLKCTTCDAVKEETLDEPEKDCKPSSKKQRTDTKTEESCSKKVKGQATAVDTIPAAHPLKPITLTHTQSLGPLWPTDHAKVYSPLESATPVKPPTLESLMVQLNPQQACIALVVEESTLVVGHSNITHPVVLYNPM
ncbi:hypothetical protein V8B97DRAFT_2026454 [Scleroderma yunnanense]